MSNNYNPHNNPHFLLLQDCFPAVAHWLKLRSYICTMHTQRHTHSQFYASQPTVAQSIGKLVRERDGSVTVMNEWQIGSVKPFHRHHDDHHLCYCHNQQRKQQSLRMRDARAHTHTHKFI